MIGPGLLSENEIEIDELIGKECKFAFFGSVDDVSKLENVKALLKYTKMIIEYYDDKEGIVKYSFSEPIPLWILDLIVEDYIPITVIYN